MRATGFGFFGLRLEEFPECGLNLVAAMNGRVKGMGRAVNYCPS
jgi:hypothetical protein